MINDMTVSELRWLLGDLPDDTPVRVEGFSVGVSERIGLIRAEVGTEWDSGLVLVSERFCGCPHLR